MLSKELISSIIPSLSQLDTGAKVLKLMNEFHLAHLPMEVDGKYNRLVEEAEILDMDDPEVILTSLPPKHFKPAVRDSAHFMEALRICGEFKLSSLPVINVEEELLGVIPQENLLQALGRLNAVNETGGWITLDIEPKDFSLSEIGRIAESNDVTVLSLNTINNPDSGKMEILLKTNKEELQSLAATFERFNYQVRHIYAHGEDENMLQRNFDLLMNYINM